MYKVMMTIAFVGITIGIFMMIFAWMIFPRIADVTHRYAVGPDQRGCVGVIERVQWWEFEEVRSYVECPE